MIRQRGNILFLILLAVVLFAALSYAVTQSTRGGGNDASNEKLSTIVAHMMQHGSAIENFLMRAKLVDNVPEYGFDFVGTYSNSLANATCTTTACKVFSSNGGSVASYRLPDGYWDTAWASSHANESFFVTPVEGIGTPAADVLLIYRALTLNLCSAVNKAMNINIDLANTAEGLGDATSYSGTMTSIPTGGSVLGDNNIGHKGQRTACFRISSGFYAFYYVVLAR